MRDDRLIEDARAWVEALDANACTRGCAIVFRDLLDRIEKLEDVATAARELEAFEGFTIKFQAAFNRLDGVVAC